MTPIAIALKTNWRKNFNLADIPLELLCFSFL